MKNFKNFLIDSIAIVQTYTAMELENPVAEYTAWSQWVELRGIDTPIDPVEKVNFYATHQPWRDLSDTRTAKFVGSYVAALKWIRGGWRNV